jgi:hypothetical protein
MSPNYLFLRDLQQATDDRCDSTVFIDKYGKEERRQGISLHRSVHIACR